MVVGNEGGGVMGQDAQNALHLAPPRAPPAAGSATQRLTLISRM